jgi:hypothetical protein
MCYDSGYYEWLRRAAQMQEQQKREEERKKLSRTPKPAAPAEAGKGVGQEEPVPV